MLFTFNVALNVAFGHAIKVKSSFAGQYILILVAITVLLQKFNMYVFRKFNHIILWKFARLFYYDPGGELFGHTVSS